MHERRWHFRGDCSTGLHQPLSTGTGYPVRYLQSVGLLQQELEGKICCNYTLQTHASPKTKLNFNHREAQRGAIQDQWMGTQGSLCSVTPSPVWHRDSANKLGSHSSEHGVCRQKTVPRSCLTRHGLKQLSAGKPSSILQCSPCLLGNPPQLGGEVSSQELLEMVQLLPSCTAIQLQAGFQQWPCRLQGWRY